LNWRRVGLATSAAATILLQHMTLVSSFFYPYLTQLIDGTPGTLTRG
jgi:hypothetical protein